MKSVILINEFYHGTRPARVIALERLCGVSLLERHLRTLKKCGVRTVSIIVPNAPEIARTVVETTTDFGEFVEVVQQDVAATRLTGDDNVLVIAGDYFIEKRLIDHLLNNSRPGLLVDSSPSNDTRNFVSRSPHASVGCALVSGATLRSLFQSGADHWKDIVESLVRNEATPQFDVEAIPTYDHAIRRYRRSMWMKVTESNDLDVAHEWVIDGAQKGSLDLPAKILHAPIENAIVSRLCATPVTPNQVTLVTNIAAWGVTWGILSGFMWPALLSAALVNILDGLDGKLARAKIMTSKVGELEHLADMVFEYSWWLSIGWVLGNSSVDSPAFMAAVGLVFLNFADSLVGAVFWLMLGRTHKRTIDNYTPFDLSVRKFSGRRNIYIWLLLLSGPFIGLELALWLCVWWGVATIIVRGGRALWLVSTRQFPVVFAF